MRETVLFQRAGSSFSTVTAVLSSPHPATEKISLFWEPTGRTRRGKNGHERS